MTNDDVTVGLQRAEKKKKDNDFIGYQHYNHDYWRNSINAKAAAKLSVAIFHAATQTCCLGEITEDVCLTINASKRK